MSVSLPIVVAVAVAVVADVAIVTLSIFACILFDHHLMSWKSAALTPTHTPTHTHTHPHTHTPHTHTHTAVFWCVLAGFVLVKTDFISVAFMSPTVNRSYFNLALVCIAINTVIAFYLCIYLPCFVRTELPWSVYCPRMIPTMTGVGTVCAILLLKSLWPVWGFLTPLILISLGMVAMFSLHFIPFLP